MFDPSLNYFKELNKLWGYLLKYTNKKIKYNYSSNLKIKVYTDLNWEHNLKSRKLSTGYITSLIAISNFNPIR